MQEIAKAAPDPTKGAYSAPPDTLFGAGGGYPFRTVPLGASRRGTRRFAPRELALLGRFRQCCYVFKYFWYLKII